jgi:hypothetical protein
MSQKTKFTKTTAGVSLSGDEAYSCSDEESGEGHGEGGQPLAAGKLPKKNHCDASGSVGKQARSQALLAWLRAAITEERRNKNDTGKNATRQPSRGSGGGTPQQEVHWRERDANRTGNKNRSGHGQQAEHKGTKTGTKGNLREPERRAERIEKTVHESAKNDEENAAASDKKRQALKALLTPARPKPSRNPHLPPSRGRGSAASSSAAASSRGPPSRGGQPSAAASPTNRDQPSAPAGRWRRLWGRGCKGSGSA